MDGFVKVKGKKIAYSDCGTGIVIVFVHGWITSKKVYRSLVEILSKKYRCVCIDMPGFGDSDLMPKLAVEKIPEILNEVLDLLKIKRFFLVGNSFGGAVSIMYTNSYPKNIIKLILISPFVNFRQFSRLVYYAIKYVIPYIINKKILTPVFEIVSAIVNFNFKNNIGDDLYDPKKKERIKNKAVYSFKLAYQLSEMDLYPKLLKIRKDILFVYGSKDVLLSIKPLEHLFGVINNIHLAIFADVRHYVFSYKSSDLAEKIDKFISTQKNGDSIDAFSSI